jgi:hypothetical protein
MRETRGEEKKRNEKEEAQVRLSVDTEVVSDVSLIRSLPHTPLRHWHLHNSNHHSHFHSRYLCCYCVGDCSDCDRREEEVDRRHDGRVRLLAGNAAAAAEQADRYLDSMFFFSHTMRKAEDLLHE